MLCESHPCYGLLKGCWNSVKGCGKHRLKWIGWFLPIDPAFWNKVSLSPGIITFNPENVGLLALKMWACLVTPMVKNLPAVQKRLGFHSWVWKDAPHPERTWQPTPVFLPGESAGQRSLAGYSPGVCRVRQDWAANTFTSFFPFSGTTF